MLEFHLLVETNRSSYRALVILFALAQHRLTITL